MIQLILTTLMMIMSLVFLQIKHPLAMGLMLLIQTMLTCLITGFLTKSFWFSYMLFLIFLGGMLVLFIYTTSLASNEMFSLSSPLMFISLTLLTMSVMYCLTLDKMTITTLINNEVKTLINWNSFIQENSLELMKLYNFPTLYLNIMLINYLLITLIAIVKITNFNFGPLRLMN